MRLTMSAPIADEEDDVQDHRESEDDASLTARLGQPLGPKSRLVIRDEEFACDRRDMVDTHAKSFACHIDCHVNERCDFHPWSSDRLMLGCRGHRGSATVSAAPAAVQACRGPRHSRRSVPSPLRQLRRDQSGSYLVMTAVTTPMLIGFVGLGTDVGLWLCTHQAMQGHYSVGAVGGISGTIRDDDDARRAWQPSRGA